MESLRTISFILGFFEGFFFFDEEQKIKLNFNCLLE